MLALDSIEGHIMIMLSLLFCYNVGMLVVGGVIPWSGIQFVSVQSLLQWQYNLEV